MDIRNLSKIKHIYRVSVDKNFDVHIVKFPVVYINKNWLYYKTERSGELSQTRTKYVRWASEFIEKGRALSWACHDNHGISNSFYHALKWAGIDLYTEQKKWEKDVSV